MPNASSVFIKVQSLLREGFNKKIKKNQGNFPIAGSNPPSNIRVQIYFFICYMGSERCFNAKILFWVGTRGNYRENKPSLFQGYLPANLGVSPILGVSQLCWYSLFPVIYSRSSEIFLKIKVGNFQQKRRQLSQIGGGHLWVKKIFFAFLDDSDHVKK